MLRSPGVAAWWAQMKAFFPDDFVDYVDRSVRETESLPTVPEALPWYRWEEAQSDA